MILTSRQVADNLGVSIRAINALALRHGIGTLLTPRQRIFTDTDVDLFRQHVGNVGRPKQSHTPSPSPDTV